MTLSAGTRLGPYEILSPLGVGGMGEVYRAKDTRLARDVAVKVLPEEFFEGEEKRQRFEREARLLASLTHPNVAAVYSFEEISGRHLLVMELIEGETLRAQLAEGTLPMKKILRIAAQVAEGLAKAHGAGIVHRDLKPENVIVTRDGFAKILDFGLAKVSTTEAGPSGETAAPTLSKMTEPGTVMGTVAYMSPEQALGRPVDFRSDLFSFGSVLYEMVTGRQAFARASAPETMTAIIREEPEPVERAAPGAPVALRWIVERCLAKDADERYGSTRDLARDLARLKDGLSEAVGPAAATLADPGAVHLPSVAVLPFVNMSADPENEFFADGITEDVIAHLAKIRTLRVISRTSVMAFKRREQGLREIGAALGVGVLVEGSVRRSKNRVRIVAQLVDPFTDEHLWSETYDRDLDDIFAIQTDVALQIASALRAELTLEERARIGLRPTRDLEAYQLYLQGRHQLVKFTKEGVIQSLALFEQAVARDPGFALAFAAMAHAHTQFGIEGISGVMPMEKPSRARRRRSTAHWRSTTGWPRRTESGACSVSRAISTGKARRRSSGSPWRSAPEARTSTTTSAGSARRRSASTSRSPWYGGRESSIRWRTAATSPTRLMRAGRTEEALAEAERAVALDPSFSRSTRCSAGPAWRSEGRPMGSPRSNAPSSSRRAARSFSPSSVRRAE